MGCIGVIVLLFSCKIWTKRDKEQTFEEPTKHPRLGSEVPVRGFGVQRLRFRLSRLGGSQIPQLLCVLLDQCCRARKAPPSSSQSNLSAVYLESNAQCPEHVCPNILASGHQAADLSSTADAPVKTAPPLPAKKLGAGLEFGIRVIYVPFVADVSVEDRRM